MKVLWSDFAVEMLREIHQYYKTKVSVKVALKIKN